MRRVWTAIRIFFVALFHAEVAAEVEQILGRRASFGSIGLQQASEPLSRPSTKPVSEQPPVAGRSDAITLLAALKREARLVDFVKEPLTGFSDAQIGAAARDVHRDCGRVLERLFSLRPIVQGEEGSEIEVRTGFLGGEAGRYRLTGNVTGEPPFSGRLRHYGWEATICELPSWSGSKSAAWTVAPVEVEL